MTKDHAISLFKSQVKLAEALGIYPSAISQWPENEIPPLRAYQIQEMQAKGLIPSSPTPETKESMAS